MFNTQSDPQSDPAGGARTGTPSRAQLALDNLLRRELRVGDPRNPQQIAKALFERYQSEPRARAIQSEAEGLPFLRSVPRFAPAAVENTATSVDLKQAMSDVDKDLENLARNNLLKDIDAELGGWSDGIRSAAQEGVNAARFGLDARNRDRALGIRRTLGDYGRLVRLVGALTPSSSYEFRSLARSIDEVCAVILVMLGESMANNGFAGGRFLLQAPFTEMQTRRDASIHALQNLLGSMSYQNPSNEWPRGIDAYRRLFDALEAQGQGDLRALMTEQELTRVLDDLVRRAAHGTAEGLRALGSTAQIELNRVYRLINFGYRLVDPESPPLTSFLEALRLFADGFSQAGGSRLLRIARPAIVFYGLYGGEEEMPSDRRIVDLTILRGRLASQLDCFARCGCTDGTALCQILMDKLLYDVDRAIDLYAVGQYDLGMPELRAAAYSYLIDAFIGRFVDASSATPPLKCEISIDLKTTLSGLASVLRPKAAGAANWDPATAANFETRRKRNRKIKNSGFRFTELLFQELCLQKHAEERWELLVAQMAPGCLPPSTVFGGGGALMTMINDAMGRVVDGTEQDSRHPRYVKRDCRTDGPDIPAHFETSLDTIAQDRARRGGFI